MGDDSGLTSTTAPAPEGAAVPASAQDELVRMIELEPNKLATVKTGGAEPVELTHHNTTLLSRAADDAHALIYFMPS